MIYDVTDLNVYNRAHNALNLVYQLAKQIPKSHIKLRMQITSAAEGIPAHIAEGFAKRRAIREWMRFLEIALGSSDEVITHARTIQILAKHFRTIEVDSCLKVITEYKIISKQLNKLRNNWIDYNTSNKKHQTSSV